MSQEVPEYFTYVEAFRAFNQCLVYSSGKERTKELEDAGFAVAYDPITNETYVWYLGTFIGFF